jgi:hypothetical protein
MAVSKVIGGGFVGSTGPGLRAKDVAEVAHIATPRVMARRFLFKASPREVSKILHDSILLRNRREF